MMDKQYDAVTATTPSRSRRTYFRDRGETGWYFKVRGGYSYGPFPDEKTAEKIMAGLIDEYIRRKLGRRSYD